MKGYIEKMEITDNGSGYITIAIPKLQEKSLHKIRTLFVEMRVAEISIRPTKRPLDGAKAQKKSKRSTGSPRK